MYQLKRNTTEGVFEASGRKKQEKEDHNVYLPIYQWEALDRRAEETGKSRNQVLREVLQDYFSQGESNE